MGTYVPSFDSATLRSFFHQVLDETKDLNDLSSILDAFDFLEIFKTWRKHGNASRSLVKRTEDVQRRRIPLQEIPVCVHSLFSFCRTLVSRYMWERTSQINGSRGSEVTEQILYNHSKTTYVTRSRRRWKKKHQTHLIQKTKKRSRRKQWRKMSRGQGISQAYEASSKN